MGMQNDAGTLEDSLVVPYKANQSSGSPSAPIILYIVYLCDWSPIYNQFPISATPLSECLLYITSAQTLGALQIENTLSQTLTEHLWTVTRLENGIISI